MKFDRYNMKVIVVFGTRPEAIKMCPLIMELKKKSNIECIVCLTGQHKEMLRQVMDTFSIQEDYNLDIMRDRQTLTSITTTILERLAPILQKENPDIVLVHGDTTTSFSAALAAFYQKIPVGHVEAGLRTGNIYSPYPEEMNRLLTGRIATYHFAPTEKNKNNLKLENINHDVYVTGNTVIDSFKTTVRKEYHFKNNILNTLDFENRRIIVVTAHRRENWGNPLQNICRAIQNIAHEYQNVDFVYPVHMNPIVRDTVYGILKEEENVKLIEPLDVLDMHNLISRSYMILTDSGGLQEEAPSFGKPVLVLRCETERQEAVEAGTVKLVGVCEEDVYRETRLLLDDSSVYDHMAQAINPYGDGHASEKIVEILLKAF